jgi:hypothetical protein
MTGIITIKTAITITSASSSAIIWGIYTIAIITIIITTYTRSVRASTK